MAVDPTEVAENVRSGLIEIGGKISQDLGLGRIVGHILVFLYLMEAEQSLSQIGEALGLSKAAVSIGARQLESFGLLQRVWVKGDRQLYYRTATNIAAALQEKFSAFIRQRLQALGVELTDMNTSLEVALAAPDAGDDVEFLHSRIKRAQVLRNRIAGIMDNRLVRLLSNL
jgi:DNA-binding transcriptional regulator GbsR (MarR family)